MKWETAWKGTGNMEAFECTGQWWLPDREKDCAAGTLKVSQSGDLRLRLVGALERVEMIRSKGHPIILGWVDKSPAGDNITLSGCTMSGRTFGSATNTRENYRVSRAYFGGHFKRQDDLLFKSMSLRLAGLSEWAYNYSGFGQESFQAAGAEEPTTLVSYSLKNPLSAKVPGGQLTFNVGLGSEGSSRQRSYREQVGFIISSETAKTSDQLNAEFVYPLQNLMTFVTDSPQEVEDFSVSPEQSLVNNANRDVWVIGPRVQPEQEGESEPVRHFQMLFTLEDVRFPDFIGEWLRVMRTYNDACGVYFGLQHGPPAYLDMTFPSVIQSLYLYYARRDDGVAERAGEEGRLKEILAALAPVDADWIVDRLGARPLPPLQLWLRKLVEEHSDSMNPLVSSRQDRFVNEVINTLKHIMFYEADMNSAARHGADLYWMIQRLRFLFKSCLLRELGFNKEKVTELFRRNSLYQHVCGLEAAIEAQAPNG
jgi:hypothetical protein